MKKLLIVGCGSIGRRHLGNFRKAGIEFIAGADPQPARLEQAAREHGLDAQYADYSKALTEHRFDGAVIATPTSMHTDQAFRLAEAGCHMFIEKPVANNLDRLYELEALCRQRGVRVFVAYCHRFISSVKKTKELLESGRIGKPYAVNVNWGSYLPYWHPWEDYRAFYMAKKALGGGALLDESHGIDLLRHLFGDIEWVSGDVGTISHLEIDSDDWASFLFRTKSGLHGKAHFDLLRHDAQVKIEVIGEKGSLTWDRIDHRITVYDAATKTYEVFPYTTADVLNMYPAETEHFISVVRDGREPAVDLADGIRTMEVVMAVFGSAHTGRAQSVPQPQHA